MKPLTRDDIIAALGRVNNTTIAEILGIGASKGELAKAKAWRRNDEPLMNTGKPPAGGRIGRLVEILERILEEEPRPLNHEA